MKRIFTVLTSIALTFALSFSAAFANDDAFLKSQNYFAQFKKIVALSNLIQRIYHNDIRNMLP